MLLSIHLFALLFIASGIVLILWLASRDLAGIQQAERSRRARELELSKQTSASTRRRVREQLQRPQ